MFGYKLTQEQRLIAQARYQEFIKAGANPSAARNAAEAITIEEFFPEYQRTPYDKADIHEVWQALITNNND
ncbi:hypothetical protein [Planktothricoides raciborskii]|uniref:Uncharacterized protein n=1 Tax=Planktothricoides raciborskii GIHE-MW2 TaxID=2792601 RepID=A0AAU8JEZ2_9CYAN